MQFHSIHAKDKNLGLRLRHYARVCLAIVCNSNCTTGKPITRQNKVYHIELSSATSILIIFTSAWGRFRKSKYLCLRYYQSEWWTVYRQFQTKCVIEFLFRQLMTSWTLRFIFDHPLKQWPTGRKRGKDRNTKNWISREWKELFRWNKKHFP